MKVKKFIAAVFCVVFLALLAGVASADDFGPWRPKSCLNIQAFGAVHFVDHADINNYIETGDVDSFGNEDWDGYGERATPVFGARIGMVFNRFVADFQGQYYKQWRDGPNTGATLSGVHFMFHAGMDLVRTRFQLYPFVGIGWSYTNFVVNGDEGRISVGEEEEGGVAGLVARRRSEFPDFSGAKEGVPADIGLGFELQNPIWTSKDENYRTAINLPVFIHVGYQGELITYFWQIKHGRLERAVTHRFMGPYVRAGFGFGKGKYVR